MSEDQGALSSLPPEEAARPHPGVDGDLHRERFSRREGGAVPEVWAAPRLWAEQDAEALFAPE